jgi:hypothetical protein
MPEPIPPGNSGKIMGLSKPLFWGIIVVGVIVAYWLYKRNQNATQSVATPSATDVVSSPDTSGLTAADIGGTPSSTGTVYQPGDYTAQFDAINTQLQQSESDLASQIAGLASAGVGTSTASAPNTGAISVTAPVTIVREFIKPKAKAKPKPKKKIKIKK